MEASDKACLLGERLELAKFYLDRAYKVFCEWEMPWFAKRVKENLGRL